MPTDLATFQKKIQSSPALKEATRTKLLAMAPLFNPDQWEAILTLIGAAEARVEAVRKQGHQKKQSLLRAYLDKLRQFIAHRFPALMQEAEQKDRANETKDLETLLLKLASC